jgi:hypothetical protein
VQLATEIRWQDRSFAIPPVENLDFFRVVAEAARP